jgi:superfamily II DNA or RNA helicase
MNYADFIHRKSTIATDYGFEPVFVPEFLFQFQRSLVSWAVKKGRAAIFADCGLGKTAMQLAWAENVVRKTGGNVIILAPLSVAKQTEREAAKFGIRAFAKSCQSEVEPGITITNYEKLHLFDASKFQGVVLDESSILKAFMGSRKRAIIESFNGANFKLACTATPAPNDHMELGNHAEFLEIMKSSEMLAQYFINDPSNVGKYRVKGHAEGPFWDWVSTWSKTISKPSDIGFSDEGYSLPKCNTHWHVVDCTKPADGLLFSLPAASLSERISARRNSVEERVRFAAKICDNDEQWLVYCALNDESEGLASAIDGASEVRGSMTDQAKESAVDGFIAGKHRVLVSKPTICGFGMNFQFCRNVMFVGMSDSWEQYYQAKRRVWRFGQKREVNCHIVTASTENAVVQNILRKEADATKMVSMLTSATNQSRMEAETSGKFTKQYVTKTKIKIPQFLA